MTVPYEMEGFDRRAYAAHHGCYLPEKDSLDEVVLPEATIRVMPEYPFFLHKAGVEGSVSYAMVIDEQGYVSDVTIYKSTDIGFHKPTWSAICKWRFTPGTVDGVPHKFALFSSSIFSVQKE